MYIIEGKKRCLSQHIKSNKVCERAQMAVNKKENKPRPFIMLARRCGRDEIAPYCRKLSILIMF